MYKFKEMQTVANAKDMVDIVLSKTQRKTPTVVHPQFKISRIRNFYTRKVKFAQSTFKEKFDQILNDFPRIDDLHPFYADLCNVLYDRDHYKLALGQLKSVGGTIDGIAKDYVKLLKFADSPYKCKMLKRAGLGRMCTAVKKLQSSLTYLEEVRQHLSRLPQINPATRSLLLTGYPNVGKSSLMNILTDANVDVQPYAFTTKSIFVGHMDYKYVRWQVLDTPGILDHPLEDRNTIEMTAITALAHIQSTVLFLLDVSEQCGFSIEEQVKLFHSIKPLFKGKPLLVLLNKTDQVKVEDLSDEQKQLLESMKIDEKVEFLQTSCMTRDGVDAAKLKACEMLLKERVDKKLTQNKHMADGVQSRLFITNPGPRQDRPPCIPESVIKARQMKKEAALKEESEDEMEMSDGEDMEGTTQVTERALMDTHGGAGVYSVDMRKHWDLSETKWKYDAIPEIMDGQNVADFVDPDIEEKLKALEAEEDALLWEDPTLAEQEQIWQGAQATLRDIHSKIRQKRLENRLKEGQGKHAIPVARHKRVVDVEKMKDHFAATGVEANTDSIYDRAKDTRRARSILPPSVEGEEMNDQPGIQKRVRPHGGESTVRERALDAPTKVRAEITKRKKMKTLNKLGKKGESDRHISVKMPKHLYSGKRGIGKTDRR